MTFLFSDIEGSTRRWETHGEAMKGAVARHEQLVSTAFNRRGGYVFKVMGDAFCVAFHSASDAIAAACDAQRALAEEDFSAVDGLRVRMGLHAGHAEERNADYFGPTINRVARLMSIGHGGQVLVSKAVAEAVHFAVPANAALIDLGLRRLKDLTQPEQVWQLTIAGVPSDFPPLNSLDARANNLPIQMTSLLGREQDVEEIRSLMGRQRLLTVSGSGGVGKTRLALQVGADLVDRFADGVWFADLAPIGDPTLVASVIASVVGMIQRGDQRVDEGIPEWLRRKNLLLILDNCEHVLDAAASLANSILAAAPNVRILATSRQALGISGEAVHRLPSLAVPENITGLHALEAQQYGSIALFVERARAVDARFALTDAAAPVVAEICRRLDGIPLAIELAAARVKVLSIPNLAQRLSERFKILTGGSRTALPRQKTLGALIEWSYGLLTPEEQSLFNRISIFAGGFSLDSAAAVCAGEGVNVSDMLDLVSSLTDKSLVVADTAGAQERYHLLESTRAFALEKLTAADPFGGLARSHAEYFRDRALEADDRFGFGSSAEWLARVEIDQDNYRAALEWALSDGHDVALGGEVAGALERFWSNAGLTAEGRYWIGRAQTGLVESAHTHVAARLWRALALLSDGKHRRDAAVRAMALYESTDDRHGSASALTLLADSLNQMGHVAESEEAYTRVLEAMRECGDDLGVARCLTQLGFCLCCRGEVVSGHEMFAQALEAYETLGDEGGKAQVLGNLAESEFSGGHVADALRFVKEALEIHTRSKNSRRLAMNYNNSAAYRIAMEELDLARAAACEGLRWARQAQIGLQTAVALQHLALVGALGGQAYRAARLTGYVDVQYKQVEYGREPTEKWGYDKLVAVLREQFSDTEIQTLAAEGAAWSEDRAVEEALNV